MKWLAATNLLPDSNGLLEFAAWLDQREASAKRHRFAVLTIAWEGHYFTANEAGLERIREGLRCAQRRALDESPAASLVASHSVRGARSVAKAIADEASNYGGVLLMGRVAKRKSSDFVRLGATTRRVIRRMETPICVVPPDWSGAQAGKGPVVVAVDPTDPSAAAAAFGSQLASELDRALLLVHALPAIEGDVAGVTFGNDSELRQRYLAQATEALHEFLRRNELADRRVHVASGATVPALINKANEVDACVLVCGSRRLSLAERVFSASVGSELAALASCPVAIVPPRWVA